jgi:hypothetical protein
MGASQAAYEGSIPFARSNVFNELAHRRVLAPGKIPSTIRTAFSVFSRAALHIQSSKRKTKATDFGKRRVQF